MTLNITQASTERFLSRYFQGALYKYVTKSSCNNGNYSVIIILWGSGVNPGEVVGRDLQILGKGDRRGSWTGHEILCQHVQDVHVCSTVMTFEEKLNNLPRSSCK